MATAEPLRVATWHVELIRKGPGLLLRDIGKGDPQVEAVLAVLAEARPDVIVLTGIDWDYEAVTLRALAKKAGYPHHFTSQPNSGVPTGLDLDGDGRLGGPADAQGFGSWRGQGGMAVLSRFPVSLVADHSKALWADQPGALLYQGMGEAEAALLRLSRVALWELEVLGLRFLTIAAGPPVFDGPEDRNGRRNHDEVLFWLRHLGEGPFVLLGNFNLDPSDGDGLKQAVQAVLADPRLQDPKPRSPGGAAAANPDHTGDPGLDTADWGEPSPGNLRVSYVLPDARLAVTGAGVFWPAPDDPKADLLSGGPRHRLVWVDLEH